MISQLKVWLNLSTKKFAGTYRRYILSLHDELTDRFGCTNVMISDQGREFVNQVNEALVGMHQKQFLMT